MTTVSTIFLRAALSSGVASTTVIGLFMTSVWILQPAALPALQSRASWVVSGPGFPLRKLDLLHRCGDQVSRRLVELVPPRDIDVVGGHRPSDRKVIDVGRYLVPLFRITRAGAGHAAGG